METLLTPYQVSAAVEVHPRSHEAPILVVAGDHIALQCAEVLETELFEMVTGRCDGIVGTLIRFLR